MMSMKFCKKISLILILLILLCSCSPSLHDDGNSQGSVSEPPIPPAAEEAQYLPGTYSLMIYMCGSNLESKSGAASDNIAEMLSATIPENVRVFIQTGGTSRWHGFGISSEHSARYEVKNGELVLLQENPPVNMGLSSSLYDFLLWGETVYPAERRGVILWDHGGGSIHGVCNDEQYYNDSLSLVEIDAAFDKMQEKSNRKYEFVGFDACLMATYDMACILEQYANYMIASEDLEPLSGWNYSSVLSQIGSDSFYPEVLRSYAEKHATKNNYTLSVTDLSRVCELDRVISEFIARISNDISMAQNALSGGMEFGISNGLSSSTNLFDLGSIAEALDIEHELSSFILTANGAANEGVYGISVYFPTEQLVLLDVYEDICQNEAYFTFLSEYIQLCPDTPIAFQNMGYDTGGVLSFTLEKSSQPYVQSVGYILYGPEDSGDADSIPCIGADNDVSFANGEYTVNFHGSWVYLDSILLHTYIYRADKTHPVYSTPVVINDEVCYLLFTYDKPTQKISVDGYVIIGDVTSRVYDVTDGLEISVLHENYITNNEVEFYVVETVVWQTTTQLSINKLEAGRYKCVPYIIDIYGNAYQGCIATIYFDGEACKIEEILK